MKVLMTPHLDDFKSHESGIKRVIEAYFRYLPDYGVKLVNRGEKYDLHAVHVGAVQEQTSVAHTHGLYWSADYNASWEFGANKGVIESVRNALQVTVPSAWVAETFQRDMRISPHVIHHGIEWTEWEPQKHEKYILFNKNRNADVCDPTPAIELAKLRSNIDLTTTFLPSGMRERYPNIRAVGLMKHPVMKRFIQRAMVYLSTTKETFGIGVLEAMASGVPVLGFDWGGNQILVEHGVNGYLAKPNDIYDLAEGLDYCMQHRDMLGANGREMAKRWNWPDAVEKVAGVYRLAMQSDPEAGRVAVVIPCYNYAHKLERTVKSALNQTFPAHEIIIVDDGSTDNTGRLGRELADRYDTVRYIHQENAGVANARNAGIAASQSEFICCLDADDQIEPRFLEACVFALKADRTLGIAYTGLTMLKEDGTRALSQWPPADPDYDKQLSARNKDDLKGVNQVPTCNVFRKEAWRRTGGYKQKYAPLGAGAEDGEFWSRIFSIGYGGKRVTDNGLFVYDLGGTVSKPFADGSGDKNLLEPQWLALHPWATDNRHPFASMATPSNGLSHPVRQYDQPDVSVIIPVGPGHEKIVEDALDSLESQTFRRWEVIVVWDNDRFTAISDLTIAYPCVKVILSLENIDDNTGESIPLWDLSTRKFYQTEEGITSGTKSVGAGVARNRGAEIARAPFLVFLDADDTLAPTFLQRCIENWRENKTIGYTDYINKSIISEEALVDFNQDDIISYIPQKQEALIRGRSAEYDCERAQQQPSRTDFFHWCLVTTFIPKVWHDAIGGFDETMESFEDVLYHWALARNGFCYTRIAEPLVSYRTYTGNRREIASLYTDEGRKKARSMLEYAESVLEGIEIMACSKCPSGQTKINVFQEMKSISAIETEAANMEDENMKMCEFLGEPRGNIGNKHVVGRITGIRYGYVGAGRQFLVHVEDIGAQPHLFRILQTHVTPPPDNVPEVAPPTPVATTPVNPNVRVAPLPKTTGIPEHIAPEVPDTPAVAEEIAPDTVVEQVVSTPPAEVPLVAEASVGSSRGNIVAGGGVVAGGEVSQPPVTVIEREVASSIEEIDLQAFPGINAPVAQQLKARGITTKQQLAQLGKEGLMAIPGIGEIRADAILNALAMESRR